MTRVGNWKPRACWMAGDDGQWG